MDNSTSNQRALFASNNGTLSITDGAIDGGSGRAVDIDNTALNVTLANVVSVGGSNPGIDLTGTTGTFTVTGDGLDFSVGGNGSGGTISNKTGSDGTTSGIGVLLFNASGVSLNRMQLNDFDNFAIRGTSVTGFVLAHSTIDGANGTSAADDEGSVRFTNLLGSADVTSCAIGGGLEDNIRIDNSTGTLDRLTVSDTDINANDTSLGNDGILLVSTSTATLNATVTGSRLNAARGDLFQSAANGSSSMDIIFTNNTVSNGHTNIVSGDGGLTFSGGDSTTVTYDISDNTCRDALGIAINVFMGTGGTANWSGTIDANFIGVQGVAGSGSEQAHGINVEAQGAGTHTTAITDNVIKEFGDRGIQLFATDGSATLNATVDGNNIRDPHGSFPEEAIYAQAGAVSTDTCVLCADITNNDFVGASGSLNDDFRLRQRKNTTFRLPGYAGGSTDDAAVVSFVQGNNVGTPSGSATHETTPPAGSGFVTGDCTPLLADGGEGPWGLDVQSLTQAELCAVVDEAIDLWSATGLSGGALARLNRATFEIADLPGGQLGNSTLLRITIDHNGAGYGWSSDVSADAPAPGQMDLLTAVMHELGHVLGKRHAEQPEVMANELPTDVRRLPAARKAEAAVKVGRVVRVEETRVATLPPPSAVPIATSIMASVLSSSVDKDGGGVMASGETVNLTIGTLNPGKSITITFEVTVNSPLPRGTLQICSQGIVGGNFPNELTDDPGIGGVDDPTCTEVDVPTSDLSITKDDGQAAAVPGTSVTYTIVVTNNGPDDATGATVSDTFPAALTCTWTCTASAGSSCTSSGTGGINDTVDLLNGGTATYTAVCDLSAGAAGTLSNTAAVTAPADRLDPTPGNDSETDVDSLVPEADLSIDKSDSPDPVVASDNLVYTITVQNAGPSDASGVVVSDTLPAGVGVAFIQTAGCAEDPNGVPTCTLGAIPAGGSAAYTVEVTTSDPASIGTILNLAAVSSAASDPVFGNDSDSEDTTVLPPNLPPVADANGPYQVDEGGTVSLDASGSSDPDGDPITFAWDLDGDGDFDDAVGATPVFSAVGLDGPSTVTVSVLATDPDGASDTASTTVDIVDVSPTVSASPATQDVQYSDRIVDVTVDATDVAADTLSVSTTWSVDGGGFVAGLPGGLSWTDNGCTVVDNTRTCTWTLSGIADVPAGVYTIRVTAQDDDGDSTDADITLNVSPEDATVTFDGTNPVAVQVDSPGGDSGAFVLAADVMEFDDPFAVVGDSKLAGNILLADVSMTLVPVGPGLSVPPSGVCSGVISSGIPDGESAHDYDILTVNCPFDEVPVNTYTLQVNVDTDGYYTGSGEDVLTVFDPSLGFTTGGGTFRWPGTDDRTNFGFNVKYHRRGKGAKGGLILIRHLADGTIFRLKSNKMTALAIGEVSGADPYGWASFTGKAIYLEPGWPDPIGNHEFVAYVEDHGTPGAGSDRFWIEVIDRDGLVVAASSMAEPAFANAETIEGGNIVVPHKTGRRGRP